MSKPETPLERLAGWCLWVTVWGPIIAIIMSLQKNVDYSFFIGFRKIVFPALLIQISLRLAQRPDPDLRKTVFLIILAVLQNPILMIHFGVAWPWWLVNASTVVMSFWAMVEVRDSRIEEDRKDHAGSGERPGFS